MRLEKLVEASLQALKMTDEICFGFALFSFQEAIGGIGTGWVYDSDCVGKANQMVSNEKSSTSPSSPGGVGPNPFSSPFYPQNLAQGLHYIVGVQIAAKWLSG